MMRALYRFLMPVIVLGLWLLLNDTLSPGYIALGLLMAIVLSWLSSIWRPLRALPKRPLVTLRLIFDVCVDITRSNLAVARIILLGERAKPNPGFINIPIELRDPHGLAMLACIITYCPGTVWSAYSEKDGILVLHVLDLQNEAEWLDIVQRRYERPLREIFE